jgi:ubiquinone/menaquinone biosynthesis C-methylase UbiE
MGRSASDVAPDGMTAPDPSARETPDVETSSERYASRFRGAAGAYMLRVQEEAVRSLLPPSQGGALLDVGGGHAQLAGPAAALGWRVTVMGSTDECRARLHADPAAAAAEFRAGDLLDLPFSARSFDVVLAVRLISHLRDWTGLVGELCRVARASVVIDYPTLAGLGRLAPLAFHAKRAAEARTTRPYRSFSPSQIDQAFEAHGFRRVATRGQFLAPMALHRLLGGARWLERAEDDARRIGLTDRFGNPVIARFDRAA